ncbi:MAG: cupredoxin domain-containing protein [Spirochaetota bacterium]
MEKREILAIILVILSTVVTIAVVFGVQIAREENIITLIAQAPEKGNFSPQVIKAEKGKEINLVIRNVDVVSHGFYIPALDLLIREIKAGEVKAVSFTFDKEGDYTFLCSVWCSDYHMQMRGEIHVR